MSEQDDFKVEAYGTVTPPPDPEWDTEPTTGSPDDDEPDEGDDDEEKS